MYQNVFKRAGYLNDALNYGHTVECPSYEMTGSSEAFK